MKRRALWVAALAVLVVLGAVVIYRVSSRPDPADPNFQSPMLGAFYSLDLPEMFETGTLRQKLVPPQAPLLGHYRSTDLLVVERHLDWAAEYGVDFLVLPYPTDELQKTKTALFLQANNIGDVRFCFTYTETADLPQIEERFFAHSSYLHIHGRPVLLLRLAPDGQTGTPDPVDQIRAAFKEKGLDLFLVGQEIDWGAQASTLADLGRRYRRFDAVTALELYDGTNPSHSGYGAAGTLLEDTERLFQLAVDATEGKVPVIPQVMPGYNSGSGTGGILPRPWKKEAEPTSLLETMLERVGIAYRDERVPIILLDSWNDWSRDTGVEPLAPAPATDEDKRFTGGYPYSGFGMAFLEELDKLHSISGRALDREGEVLTGTSLSLWRGNKEIDRDLLDSRGRFHFTTQSGGLGGYRVGPTLQDSVHVDRTTSDSKLELSFKSASPSQPPPPSTPDFEPRLGVTDWNPEQVVRNFKSASFRKQPDGSHSLYLKEGQALDPELSKTLRRWVRPGQTVVEINSGTGASTVLLSDLVGSQGKVYAFEPRPDFYAQTAANLALNNATSTTVLPFAIGRRADIRTAGRHRTEQRNLDSFHLPSVDLVVVHNEPAEVVLGASKLLKSDRPRIVWSERPENARTVLSSIGYLFQNSDTAAAFPEDDDSLLIDVGSKSAGEHLIEGFSLDEQEWPDTTFRWSDGVESKLLVWLQDLSPGDYVLGFRARAFASIAPVEVEVLLNGTKLGTLEFGADWEAKELKIPEGLIRRGDSWKNPILLVYSKTARPAMAGEKSNDIRPISLALDKVWLYPASPKQ